MKVIGECCIITKDIIYFNGKNYSTIDINDVKTRFIYLKAGGNVPLAHTTNNADGWINKIIKSQEFDLIVKGLYE